MNGGERGRRRCAYGAYAKAMVCRGLGDRQAARERAKEALALYAGLPICTEEDRQNIRELNELLLE